MRSNWPRRGADNPAAKLSPAQARHLKARYMTGETSLRSLAREAGVSHQVVWRIANGISYPEEK